MNILQNIRNILNLNWKKVKIIGYHEEDKKIIYEIRWKYSSSICPHCWLSTTKRKDRDLHIQKGNLKHMPYWWNKIIELKLSKRYFRCDNCKSNFYERFDFESPFWLYTNHFEKYIQWNWWFVSWNKISQLYQSSNSVIYSILERIDINLINERWFKIIEELDEIYLWVDEHSFSGHNMVLVITELKTKQLLAVLKWITKEILEEWIWKIPLKHQLKIKGFATDMNKWYAKSLNQIIWNPIQSVDKFHLFWEANDMIDEVRQISIWWLSMNFIKIEDIPKLGRKIWKKLTKEDIENLNKNSNNEIMSKYKKEVDMRLKADQIDKKALVNSKWQIMEYKEITADYFIEKWYRKIFLYREKNLSPIQKLRINQIFREFDYLKYMQQSWTLKEDFMDAMDNLNLKEIDRIMIECLESEHYRIKQFWNTLKRWYRWIKWFCEHSTPIFKFTNALTESFNNLCKVAKRISHWFRTKEMYIKKLVARFCLKELKI